MDDLFADSPLQSQTLTRTDIEALTGIPRTLIGCDLEEVDLGRMDLSGWVFRQCYLRHADFSGAQLEGTSWQSCRGAFTRFIGSDLTDAQMVGSDFNNGSFRGAILQGAALSGCKLTGADLAEVQAIDCAMEEVLLVNARLPGWSFRKAVLKRVDFAQADLRQCDFRDAVLEQCSLRNALLDGARFDGADLRGADLGGVRLADASAFRGATISRDQAGQLLRELGLVVR